MIKSLVRVWRHLVIDQWLVGRAFTSTNLNAIRAAITDQERRHSGELRFAVEGGLPLRHFIRGQSARARAVECFADLGIWDTSRNNGVLIYLLLADRRVEIVADRGIHSHVGAGTWELICGEMQRDFAGGRFEEGVVKGLAAVGDLLAVHYPHRGDDVNELPDDPVII